MLSAEYNELSAIISRTLYRANQLLSSEKRDSDEDNEAYKAIEFLCEVMEASKNKITYLSKETTEGQLHEQSNGRFELLDDCGKYIAEFSCGIPIEILLYDNLNKKEIWQFGRVESRQRKTNDAGYENEYYFKNGNDNPALKNSMKARVRD